MLLAVHDIGTLGVTEIAKPCANAVGFHDVWLTLKSGADCTTDIVLIMSLLAIVTIPLLEVLPVLAVVLSVMYSLPVPFAGETANHVVLLLAVHDSDVSEVTNTGLFCAIAVGFHVV